MPKSLRILLVEDDAEDALLFQRRCPPGFRVQHVESAEAALTALRAGTYELCFTDYRLGTVTGLDLVRSARAEGQRLPIVVMTGQDVDSLGENALLAGATDFLPKDDLSSATLDRVARWALIRRHVENRRVDSVSNELVTRLMGRPPRGPLPATPPDLRRVLYLSRARRTFSAQDLLLMCGAFSAANAATHVTGVLVHAGNRFLQIIEGEPDTIEILLRRIEADARHGDMSVVLDEPVGTRLFAQWNMSCLHLDERYELSPTQWQGVRGQILRLLGGESMTRERIAQLIASLPALLGRAASVAA